MPDAHAGPVQPSLAHASEVPIPEPDEDSPWSADEGSGPAGAAFGAVDFVTGPITFGPAEPDQAEQSTMQVSSTQEPPQHSKPMTSQHDLPAEELAQLREQDASSPEALRATSPRLYQPVEELTQQVPAGQLPDHYTPVLQQTAGAAVGPVATTTAMEVAAEHSAVPAAAITAQAAHEEGSPQAGAQPASSTPLYTCHLQGLGEAPLDMFSQEDAVRAGTPVLLSYSRPQSRK